MLDRGKVYKLDVMCEEESIKSVLDLRFSMMSMSNARLEIEDLQGLTMSIDHVVLDFCRSGSDAF